MRPPFRAASSITAVNDGLKTTPNTTGFSVDTLQYMVLTWPGHTI